jgi:hypothetical protein
MNKFTPNGEMDLKFNQKLIVPFDLTEETNQTGRLL